MSFRCDYWKQLKIFQIILMARNCDMMSGMTNYIAASMIGCYCHRQESFNRLT